MKKQPITDRSKDAIAAARQVAGMTQEQAAEAVGVTKSTWAKWESGMHPAPLTYVQFFLLVTGQAKLQKICPRQYIVITKE